MKADLSKLLESELILLNSDEMIEIEGGNIFGTLFTIFLVIVGVALGAVVGAAIGVGAALAAGAALGTGFTSMLAILGGFAGLSYGGQLFYEYSQEVAF